MVLLFQVWSALSAEVNSATVIDAKRQQPSVGKLRGEGEFDSATHRLQLLTNFTRYALVYPGNRFGYVPTNTVALGEYALELLLKLANEMNEKWKIGMPSPITSDHVTKFGVLPKTNKMTAGITVVDRYQFGFSEGKLINYRDLDFWINTYENKPEKFRERAKQPDRLSKAKALRLAQDSLHALGLTEEQLKISKRPVIEQESYTPEGRTKAVAFPHYRVTWKRGYRGERDSSSPIRMEVSGITGTVVAFENSSENSPRMPLPTNYWQMLGMSPP